MHNHRLFGLDNVGFHMGSDAVTIDLSGELDAEQLAQAAPPPICPLSPGWPPPSG